MEHSARLLNDVEKNGIGSLGMGISGEAVLSRLLSLLPGLGKTIPLILRDKSKGAVCPLKKEDFPLLCCRFGEHWLEDIREPLLFRSPVIRPDLPQLRHAVACGAVCTSEIAWTIHDTPAKRFLVTGSDGKTSTSSMLYSIFSLAGEQEGYQAYLGGNIGRSLLKATADMRPTDRAVFEISSFQLLDLFPKSEVATVTNLTPNHLDVHTSFEEYKDAKLRIFKNASQKVISADCPHTLCAISSGDILWSSSLSLSELKAKFGNHPFVWRTNQTIYYTEGNTTAEVMPIQDLYFKEGYQVSNAMTAIGMAFPFVKAEYIRQGLATFSGVAHRMQRVARYGNVLCYDSSIDTTPSRVKATLSALGGKPTVICGGSDKGLDYLPLAYTLLSHSGRVVLAGQTKEAIYNALTKAMQNTNQSLPVFVEKDFKAAVQTALSITPEGESLVLSPGCASFDAFRNYQDKSRAFLDILLGMGAVPIS